MGKSKQRNFILNSLCSRFAKDELFIKQRFIGTPGEFFRLLDVCSEKFVIPQNRILSFIEIVTQIQNNYIFLDFLLVSRKGSMKDILAYRIIF